MTAPTFTNAAQVADAIRALQAPDHDATMGATRLMQMRAAHDTITALLPLTGFSQEARDLIAAVVQVERDTYACAWWDQERSDMAIEALETAADAMLTVAGAHHEAMCREGS